MGRLVSLLVLLAGSAAAAETASEESAAGKNPSLAKEVEDYLAETQPAAGEDTTFKAFWKEGLRLETADGSFKLHFGGRFSWDTIWFTSDDFASSETQDTSYFRMVRFVADGTIFTNAFFKIEIDFAGGTVALKDVYMGLRKLGVAGTFTAGHFKEPFGWDELTNDSFITFMERAAPSVAFVPSRNDGFMLNNNFLEDGRLGVFLGIFRTANDQGVSVDDGSYALTTRFCAFFFHDKDLNRVLHAEFAYSFRNATNDALQFRTRPDVGTGAYFVDTGTFTANEANLFDFAVFFLYKVFHAQAEFFLADCGGAGGPEPTFTGWYVEVGWFITGGMRQYSPERKTMDRPRIDQNFHAGKGGPGAWQLAVRFDSTDLTDSGVAGGVQECITIGLNWYWNPQMRVMFNVIFADISDGGPFGEGKLTIFGTRFQFDF